MVRLAFLAVVIVGAAAPAQAGDDCVAIKKGKPAFADRKGKRKVGKTTATVPLRVEKRKGAWLLLDARGVVATSDGFRESTGGVSVWVRKRDTRKASCPETANSTTLGLTSEHATLYWRDGSAGGGTRWTRIRDRVRCSKDTVVLGEQVLHCFAWETVPGLTVDVCADPAVSTVSRGSGPALPCDP